MAPRSSTLVIGGNRVAVTRKRIKHLYVKVSRADGAVRVSAPLWTSDDAVRELVTAKLAWIRGKQRAIAHRPTRPERRFQDGELHRVWGRSVRLHVRENAGRRKLEVMGPGDVALHVAEASTIAQRRQLFEAFYRAELEDAIPRLVARWEPVIGRRVGEWGVKKMRTRWGSCNPRARRIWLSLELAAYPPECLEYVVVHEMAHLIEANHGPRFYALMDRLLPDWRERRRALESGEGPPGTAG